MSVLAQSFLSFSVRTHHKFQKILTFLHQQVRTSASEKPLLVRKMSALDNLPTSDCGGILWTAPLHNRCLGIQGCVINNVLAGGNLEGGNFQTKRCRIYVDILTILFIYKHFN